MFNRKIIGYLERWHKKPNRKPLVIRGARQVGKTSAVLIFGKKHFSDMIHLNLEKAEHMRLFRESVSLNEFLTIVKAEFKKSITPGKTLIFIDEIQNSPVLIKLLRFFLK